MIDARTNVHPDKVADLSTGQPVWALGMMTGTSMDGVDLALVRTDGETIGDFGPSWTAPIWPSLADDLRAALPRIAELPTGRLRVRSQWPAWLVKLEERVTDLHTWSILGFQFDQRIHERIREGRSTWEMPAKRPLIFGIHGQTVIHRPSDAFTLQLFDAWRHSTGLVQGEVVSCFRQGDLRAGGEGAPLAPFYHFALARHLGATEPLAFLNIGGVGNVTWIDPSKAAPEEPGALIAFDTGPGNALVNDWMQERTGSAFDADGVAAAAGAVQAGRLATNSGQAYLDRRPPKSLDRNDFHGVLAAMEGLSINDGAATLTAFTADCVAASVQHVPSPPTRWLVCGGGRHNRTMMAMLAERLAAPVEPVEAVGLDGDMLEAQAFAYLAVRVLRGLPTSAPSTTGCREPVCGGRISYP